MTFLQWKDTDAGAQLLKRMNCLEHYRKDGEQKNLVGGDAKGPQYAAAQQFLDSHPELHYTSTLSKDEWEAITLYLVFAFKKKSQ